jgi:hypothetical protein
MGVTTRYRREESTVFNDGGRPRVREVREYDVSGRLLRQSREILGDGTRAERLEEHTDDGHGTTTDTETTTDPGGTKKTTVDKTYTGPDGTERTHTVTRTDKNGKLISEDSQTDRRVGGQDVYQEQTHPDPDGSRKTIDRTDFDEQNRPKKTTRQEFKDGKPVKAVVRDHDYYGNSHSEEEKETDANGVMRRRPT